MSIKLVFQKIWGTVINRGVKKSPHEGWVTATGVCPHCYRNHITNFDRTCKACLADGHTDDLKSCKRCDDIRCSPVLTEEKRREIELEVVGLYNKAFANRSS